MKSLCLVNLLTELDKDDGAVTPSGPGNKRSSVRSFGIKLFDFSMSLPLPVTSKLPHYVTVHGVLFCFSNTLRHTQVAIAAWSHLPCPQLSKQENSPELQSLLPVVMTVVPPELVTCFVTTVVVVWDDILSRQIARNQLSEQDAHPLIHFQHSLSGTRLLALARVALQQANSASEAVSFFLSFFLSFFFIAIHIVQMPSFTRKYTVSQ